MIQLNWHPYANNPIDFIPRNSKAGWQLITPSGESVKIELAHNDFIVTIDGKRETTGGNTETCYYLNQCEVGLEDR